MAHDTTPQPILVIPSFFDVQRFWSRVRISDGCWEWQGHTTGRGYGSLRIDKHPVKTHRLSWFIHFGQPGDKLVCHTCDNPRCVRPDHLFLGTHPDNMGDMARKGRAARGESNGASRHPERMPKGERHGNSKLTEDDVRYIRRTYTPVGPGQRNPSLRYLADMFGLSVVHVRHIAIGKSWAHVTDIEEPVQHGR